MSETEQLLPCPWCGSPGMFVYTDGTKPFGCIVVCESECSMASDTEWHDTEKAAAGQWNTRASPAPAASSVETVARIIDPRAWEFADRHTPNPIMAIEIKHETRASLEKARLILAALPDAPVPAKDGEGEG